MKGYASGTSWKRGGFLSTYSVTQEIGTKLEETRKKMEQVSWHRPSLLCAFALSGCHKLCSHACTVKNWSHKPKSIAPLSKLWQAFCQRREYTQCTSHKEWPGKHGLVLCVNSTVSEYLVDSRCFFSFTAWFLYKSQWLQLLSPSLAPPLSLLLVSLELSVHLNQTQTARLVFKKISINTSL